MNRMTLALVPALEADKPILANLYSLYLHDLSAYTERLTIHSDGSFVFDDLDYLWEEDGISPFLIKYDDHLIGFLLLLERPYLKKEIDYSVNDIFILNSYRGKGLGLEVIENLFQSKPGSYYIIELSANKPAIIYWKKVYQKLNISFKEVEEHIDEDACLIQTFDVDESILQRN